MCLAFSVIGGSKNNTLCCGCQFQLTRVTQFVQIQAFLKELEGEFLKASCASAVTDICKNTLSLHMLIRVTQSLVYSIYCQQTRVTSYSFAIYMELFCLG